MKTPQVLTVGHSNQSWEAFYRLLELSGADAIIDVRARPYSRWPHFNGPELMTRLNFHGWPYQFLGHQLGGLRGGDTRTFHEVSQKPEFEDGIVKVLEIARHCRPALLCSEGDVLACHRLLVSRALAAKGARIEHILRHGEIEDHAATELRMLKANKLSCEDYWSPYSEILDRAYQLQERRIREVR